MNYAKFDGTDRVQRPDEVELPLPRPFPKKLEKLTGTLTEFKAVITKGPFEDRFYSRLAALAQGKAGGITQEDVSAVMLGAAGHGVAAFTSFNKGPMFQTAMYIFAELDGQPLRGWLECCEFKMGDEIEVIAEWTGEHYEVYAIIRPKDESITVYPECRNGLNASRISALFIYLLCSSVLWLIGFLMLLALQGDWWQAAYISAIVAFGALGGITSIDIYRSTKKTQVALAERIFKSLGWQNVKNISLDYMGYKKNKELKKMGGGETWKFESYSSGDSTRSIPGGAARHYYYPDMVYGKKKR